MADAEEIARDLTLKLLDKLSLEHLTSSDNPNPAEAAEFVANIYKIMLYEVEGPTDENDD